MWWTNFSSSYQKKRLLFIWGWGGLFVLLIFILFLFSFYERWLLLCTRKDEEWLHQYDIAPSISTYMPPFHNITSHPLNCYGKCIAFSFQIANGKYSDCRNWVWNEFLWNFWRSENNAFKKSALSISLNSWYH